MKFTLLLLLALVCVSYQMPEFDQGTAQDISWSTPCQHDLHCDNTPGRSLTFQVNFNREFSAPPQVITGMKLLDMGAGTPIGLDLTVNEVTNTGFSYTATSIQAAPIFTIQLNWLAILDNNVRINYANQNLSIDNLNHTGFTKTLNIEVQPSQTLNCPNGYNGAVFLQGFNLQAGDQEAKILYSESTSENISLILFYEAVQTDYISFVSIHYCSDYGESWVSFVSQYSEDYPSLLGSGKRSKRFDHQVERTDLLTSESFVFTGLSVFEQADSSGANFRINYEDFAVSDGTYSQTLVTWGDTQLSMGMYSVVLYQPQNPCAVLYSECDFQGDSIEVCSGEPVNSMAAREWGDKNVRSVIVPPGRTLTLFDAENLEGPYTQVQGEVRCSSGWTFTGQ